MTPPLPALRLCAVLSSILAILFWPGLAWDLRAADAKRTFDVPTGAATMTLKRFAQQAGQQVVYPAYDVRGIKTNEVKGAFTAQEGIAALLADTGLKAVFDEQSGAFAVSRITDPNGQRAVPIKADDRSVIEKKKEMMPMRIFPTP